MSARRRLWIGVIFLVLLLAVGVGSILMARRQNPPTDSDLDESRPAVKNIETH